MFRKQVFTTVFAIAALSSAFTPTLLAAHFDEKVRNDFFAGFAGDKAAFARAMQTSEETIASDPNQSAEALAWHGGGLMVLSGEKFQQGDFAAGGDLWARGVTEMEKAGALEPDNPGVLIPRAAVWFVASRQAPPDRGKPILEKAIADYEHVYEIQKPFFDKLDVHMRSELLFGLADGHARNGNPEKAHFYFEKLAAIGAASGHFDQAQQYLNGQKYTIQGIGCSGCHTASK